VRWSFPHNGARLAVTLFLFLRSRYCWFGVAVRIRSKEGLLGPLVAFPGGLAVDVPPATPMEPPAFTDQFPFVPIGILSIRGSIQTAILLRTRTIASFHNRAVVVVVSLLLGKNEDRPALFGGQTELLLDYPVVVAMWFLFVVLDSKGLFRHVGPSQLDGTSLRTARMIPKNLRVGSNLAIPKGNGRLGAETRVGRERFLAGWNVTDRQIAIHNVVVVVVVVTAIGIVVGRCWLSFQ